MAPQVTVTSPANFLSCFCHSDFPAPRVTLFNARFAGLGGAVNRYLLSIAICCLIPGVGHAAAGQAAGVAEINAAIELGRLNAAQTAPERAASNSAVGAIVTYENQMNAALARSDQ